MGLLPFNVFLKNIITSRTTDGNFSDENESQQQNSDLPDLEEVNSFIGSLNDIKDIQRPKNSVSVPESKFFTISSVSNLLHSNTSTNISKNSDTYITKMCSMKRMKKQENKNFEKQKINELLESQNDKDMFLKSLH